MSTFQKQQILRQLQALGERLTAGPVWVFSGLSDDDLNNLQRMLETIDTNFDIDDLDSDRPSVINH